MVARPVRAVVVIGVAAMTLVLGQAPAMADYGGTAYAAYSSRANYGYTVRRLNSIYAEMTGTLRDTAADGACAYVRLQVEITNTADPVTTATVCGRGSTKAVGISGRSGNYLPPDPQFVTGIRIRVCLIANGSIFGCQTKLLTNKTS